MAANMIMEILMNKLKVQNPQEYKMVSEAIQNNGNPEMMLNQMMTNISPEQKQSLLKQAKNYGVPDNILSKIQNMK